MKSTNQPDPSNTTIDISPSSTIHHPYYKALVAGALSHVGTHFFDITIYQQQVFHPSMIKAAEAALKNPWSSFLIRGFRHIAKNLYFFPVQNYLEKSFAMSTPVASFF